MATVYIAETGDDSTGDGTETNPWATLVKAHAETTDGDTIVMSGTYDLQTGDGFIRARTYSGYDATLIKSGTGQRDLGVVNGNVIVEGFTWTGLFDSDHSRSPAFFTSTGNGLIVFENNVFQDIVGRAEDTPLRASSSLFGSGASGGQPYVSSNVNFVSCLIDNPINHPDGGAFIFVGMKTDENFSSTVKFIGCTVFFSEGDENKTCLVGTGRLNTDLTEYEFKNNIFYSVDGKSFDFSHPRAVQSLFTSDHNCYYGNWNRLPDLGDNDIEQDPKFIDAPNGDFRLQTNSPCLGTGNPAI